MPARSLDTPDTALVRLGRASNPLTWTPWRFVGTGRFDDPRPFNRRFRVLYAGDRRVSFHETLADLRPPLGKPGDPFVASDWLANRRLALFRILDPNQRGRWLDLRTPETFQYLRRRFASLLAGRRFTDFDVATATTGDLVVTQAIAEWAYIEGYQGIAYLSRLDPALTCWAMFERPGLLPIVDVEISSIADDDPDLRYAIDLFGLQEQSST